MAKSKNATDAAKSGSAANTQTPQDGGKTKAQPQTQESTMQHIDFQTGLLIDATPAETGDSQPEPTQPMPEVTPTESGKSQGFSQADVDKIVRERLERERSKYADYDTLKAAAEELNALKGQTEEEEKLLAEKLADAQSKRQTVELQLREEQLRNAILSEAAGMGFSNPNDAYLLADIASLEIDEDGNAQGIREVLESLQADKPYLLRRQVPDVSPANVSRTEQQGRTDGDRFAEYFGGGQSGGFWRGGLRAVDIDDLEKN